MGGLILSAAEFLGTTGAEEGAEGGLGDAVKGAAQAAGKGGNSGGNGGKFDPASNPPIVPAGQGGGKSVEPAPVAKPFSQDGQTSLTNASNPPERGAVSVVPR